MNEEANPTSEEPSPLALALALALRAAHVRRWAGSGMSALSSLKLDNNDMTAQLPFF